MKIVNKDEDGGNAFPIPGLQDDPEFNGMSLRDYFAAKVIQGIYAYGAMGGFEESDAKRAYKMAEAMLRARND